MARRATGEVRKLADGYQARVRIDAEHRHPFDLDAFSDDDARKKTAALSAMARRLRAVGRTPEEIIKLLSVGAESRANWDATVAAVDFVCAGKVEELALTRKMPTWREFFASWTSGDLHKLHPDHVRQKRSADEDRLRNGKHIDPVLGPIPIDRITLDDCERVMARIPSEASPASRRQIAQCMARALKLAVYPCRYRAESPVPQGWLPRLGKRKAFEMVYPDEDRALMRGTNAAGETVVPLLRRLFFGFLAREGMRKEGSRELAMARRRPRPRQGVPGHQQDGRAAGLGPRSRRACRASHVARGAARRA